MKNIISKAWSDEALHSIIKSSEFLKVSDYREDMVSDSACVIFESKVLSAADIEAGAYDFEDFVTSSASKAIAESLDSEVFEALTKVSRDKDPITPKETLFPFFPALIHSKIEEGFSVIVSNSALIEYPALSSLLRIDGVKMVKSEIPEVLIIDLKSALDLEVGNMTALRTATTEHAVILIQELEVSIKVSNPSEPALRIGEIPAKRKTRTRNDVERHSNKWKTRPAF